MQDTHSLRRCSDCNIMKPGIEFGRSPKRCISCRSEGDNHRYSYPPRKRQKHSGSRSEQQLAAHRKRAYGVTREDVATLIADQGGVCGICSSVMVKPAVDHDHLTGKVRGVVCHTCNSGIGFLRDDVEVLRGAVAYLEKHSTLKESSNQTI